MHGPFVGAAAQRVRDHRQAPPCEYGVRAAGQLVEQQAACVLTRLVHVDVGIGLEADGNVRQVDELLREVAVQVQRHGNGNIGHHRAQAFEQIALTVVAVLGDHRAVQVEHQRIAPRRSRNDGVAQRGIGVGGHAPARAGSGDDGHDNLRARRLR